VTIWDEILTVLQRHVPPEDFRRWFIETAYASDSGDQITVWVPTESVRRHVISRYEDNINAALAELNRRGTHVRFVVTGVDEDDDVA
jgi:chromosomal replication initiation ATPase DnaA